MPGLGLLSEGVIWSGTKLRASTALARNREEFYCAVSAAITM